MISLSIIGLSFIGAVFWVVSTEALAMYWGSQGWNPFYVGALCSLGQNGMYVVVYFFGEQLMKRWRWLEEQVARLRVKLGHGARRGYLITTGVGHVLGVPPAPATVALGPGFGVGLKVLLPITFAGRYVRFVILASVGPQLLAWWQAL